MVVRQATRLSCNVRCQASTCLPPRSCISEVTPSPFVLCCRSRLWQRWDLGGQRARRWAA